MSTQPVSLDNPDKRLRLNSPPRDRETNYQQWDRTEDYEVPRYGSDHPREQTEQISSQPKIGRTFSRGHDRIYPFMGTVLMGALLNIAIFQLSSTTRSVNFIAFGVLGSLGVNTIHAILKMSGHSPDKVSEKDEVYDSKLRFIHITLVKPLALFMENIIPPLTKIKVLQDIASGVFHHTDPQKYQYADGRRDIQLIISGVITAFLLKKIVPLSSLGLRTTWQAATIATLLPTLWSKSTQLPIASGDLGKPWSFVLSLLDRISARYAQAVSQRGRNME